MATPLLGRVGSGTAPGLRRTTTVAPNTTVAATLDAARRTTEPTEVAGNQSESPIPQPPEGSSSPEKQDRAHRALADVGPLLGLINGVIAAIVGAYATTGSLLVTVIAGGAALLIAIIVINK